MIATTSAVSLDVLLRGQLQFLSRYYEVTALASPGPGLRAVAERERVATKSVKMIRQPSPLNDFLALAKLILLLSRLRPDLLHAYTPKAGLLATLAGMIARVPVRVRSVNGLPLMEAQGAKRWLLTQIERVSLWAATDVLANSTSLRDYVQRNLTKKSVGMIGAGSTNGVDVARFTLDPLERATDRKAARDGLGIPDSAMMVLYIGRLVRDKGIEELVEAFEIVAHSHPELRLVLVGGQEEANAVAPETMSKIRRSDRIVSAGWKDDVRPYLAAADLLALPSYREGLPNVLLQAACAGVPVLATDVPGCRDVIDDGSTGWLVSPKDPVALATALRRLSDNPFLRERLAVAARNLIPRRFDQMTFWTSLQAFYEDRLKSRRPDSSLTT